MMGFHCPHIPGYDTTGLPIKQAVTKKLTDKFTMLMLNISHCSLSL